MRKSLLFAMAMLIVSLASANVNTVVINTTGDVTLRQGETFEVSFDMENPNFTSDWFLDEDRLTLNGTGDFLVTVPVLEHLMILSSSGDVTTDGMLKGQNLAIEFLGSGDAKLNLDYDNVYVMMTGTGDLELRGSCDALMIESTGRGDLDARKLSHTLSLANLFGHGDVNIGKTPKYIAYHATDEKAGRNYVDEGWAKKCGQGDRVRFEEVDGTWRLNGCNPDDPAVVQVMQQAAPFFASMMITETRRSDNPDPTADMATLAELLAQLGTNLEALADSVDWKSFESDMERWGESMEEWGRQMEQWGDRFERRINHRYGRYEGQGSLPQGPKESTKPQQQAPKKKSLLFDPHWNGFDAGLNMLLGPGSAANFEGPYSFLEQKPMKSWVFNFNIADVGIAFNRRHIGGLYTGIGLGWNNYSFNHPVRLYKTEDHRLEGEWIDEVQEGKVKKSKLGVLYVQAPLMIEMRPERNFHIAAGVVGGIRVDAWNKVKFIDKSKETSHSDFYLNLLKLDAELRAGGDDMGFFASFNLLPLFYEANGPTAHTLCFGFSLLF